MKQQKKALEPGKRICRPFCLLIILWLGALFPPPGRWSGSLLSSVCTAFSQDLPWQHGSPVCTHLYPRHALYHDSRLHLPLSLLGSRNPSHWKKFGVRSPKFIWAHVYCCTHWLRPRNPPPPHLGSYTRALLVSQDRRHLLVTPGGSKSSSSSVILVTSENDCVLSNVLYTLKADYINLLPCLAPSTNGTVYVLCAKFYLNIYFIFYIFWFYFLLEVHYCICKLGVHYCTKFAHT